MKHLLLAILCAAAISGCTHSIDTVNLGIDDVYYIYRMQKLPLHSALTGEHYRWSVDGRDCGTDAPDYIFLAAEEGTYSLSFDIIDAATPYHFDFTVHVLHEEVEYSPYIARVYEYRPAPGQFVNEMPKYEPGDTEADMVRKAQDCISGTNDVMISLGAYGGYVTFGFDHTVVNIPGEYDFRIWGNAFYELINPELKGGSCEPGIVWVSYDTNCNGLPDDTWYELAGSDYGNPATRHAYTLTYSAPDPDREPVKNGSFIDDAAYSLRLRAAQHLPQTELLAYVAPRQNILAQRLLPAAKRYRHKRQRHILRALLVRMGICRQPPQRQRRTQQLQDRLGRRRRRHACRPAGHRLRKSADGHQPVLWMDRRDIYRTVESCRPAHPYSPRFTAGTNLRKS